MKPPRSLFWSQPALCSCTLRALGQHPQSTFISSLVKNRLSAVGWKGSRGWQTPLLSGTLAWPSWESNSPTHFPVLGLHRRCETAASLNARPPRAVSARCSVPLRSMDFRLFVAGCVWWLFAEAQGTRGLRFQLPPGLPWVQHILHIQRLWRKSRLWLMVAYIVPLSLCQLSQEEQWTGSQDQRPHPSCPSTSPCPVWAPLSPSVQWTVLALHLRATWVAFRCSPCPPPPARTLLHGPGQGLGISISETPPPPAPPLCSQGREPQAEWAPGVL